ncbi:hypothetical protein ACWGDT_44500 [Streptomyces avermitilis]
MRGRGPAVRAATYCEVPYRAVRGGGELLDVLPPDAVAGQEVQVPVPDP